MADSTQRQDPENLQNAEKYRGGAEPEAGRSNAEVKPMDEDRTYDPSTVAVNRGREQGLGVGQKDLDYQRDPTGWRSAEQYSDEPPQDGHVRDPGGDDSGVASQAGPPGPIDKDYDERDRDQVDTDWPAG